MTNAPKYRQDWILDLLKSEPNMSYGEVFTKYLQVFTKLSRQTFSKDWKKAKEQLNDYQKKAQKEKERVSLEVEAEAVKSGLKTKIDRLLNYQKLVDDCLKDLAEGMTNDVAFKDGEPKQYRRKMTIAEYNQTRKTLKDLQTEISKIEGDYATGKIDITSNGKELATVPTAIQVEIVSASEEE